MKAKIPKLVGLTGGIGSGKSAVAECFADLGVPVVDTDVIAHELTAGGGAAMPAIVDAFGESVRGADGALDRAVMRALVFGDPACRQRLEAILHPMIEHESLRRVAAANAPYVMLAVPLLFESGGYLPLLWRSLVVDCREELQIERVMRRSGLDEAAVRAIMAAQCTREQRNARADDIIDNNGTISAMRLQVERKHRYYHAILDKSGCLS
ncbi:dephospho-CoA kinase [Paludibacterium yongneupense]|uniref:dephospho-CoA kinase n=1 Tax=Paludibacterium yongneupense TaxID=400061 RepID=UPI00041B459A|nr:dephospho-CoA kinase [Paludibacterium yongneupense]